MELLPLHKLSAKHYTAVLRGLYILLENAFVSLGRGLNLVLGSKAPRGFQTLFPIHVGDGSGRVLVLQ